MLRQGLGQLASSGFPTEPVVSISSATLQFATKNQTDVVTNAIGSVALDTTVAELELGTTAQLLASMLQIAPPAGAPTPAEFGATLTLPQTTFEMGSTTPLTGIVRYDRGVWSPEPTGGAMPPYGIAGSVASTSEFAVISSIAAPSAQGRVVDIAFNFVFAPTTLSSWQVSAIVFHDPGEAIVDNAGNAVTPVPANIMGTNELTVQSFAPVYLGVDTPNTAPADAAASNLPSTSQVFTSTAQVVVVAHDRATPILVPKQPTDILQFEKVFFDSFISVWSQTDVYTVTPVTVSLNGTDVQYYSVEWQVNRPARDVRIDF